MQQRPMQRLQRWEGNKELDRQQPNPGDRARIRHRRTLDNRHPRMLREQLQKAKQGKKASSRRTATTASWMERRLAAGPAPTRPTTRASYARPPRGYWRWLLGEWEMATAGEAAACLDTECQVCLIGGSCFGSWGVIRDIYDDASYCWAA